MEEGIERIESGMAALIEAQRRSDAVLLQLVQTIGSFADSANARMKRIEDNLDLLIRALIASPSPRLA